GLTHTSQKLKLSEIKSLILVKSTLIGLEFTTNYCKK
ncbi:MAG: hypothetical protein ACI920_002591, partial [Saprospiraceae bacterium]